MLNKNFYSLKEVRNIVFNDAISISLLQKMVREKIIPADHFGGRILVPKYWLVAKIEEANNGSK